MGTSLLIFICCSFLLFGSSSTDSDTKTDFDLDDVLTYVKIFGMGEETALHDATDIYHKETKLLYTIAYDFKKLGLKKRPPPPGEEHRALNIFTNFSIDHVEPLDQEVETMTTHGSVTMRWMDPMYVWDPEKFDKIKVISRDYGDYNNEGLRPWTPEVFFKTADQTGVRRAENAERFASIITVKYTGEVIMHKKFSVTSSCDFNFRDFPYDTQRCMLIMTSQHTFREVWFTDDRIQNAHSARQLKKERNTPTIGDFVLDYIHVFNTILNPEMKPVQLKGPWKEGDNTLSDAKMASVVSFTFTRISNEFVYAYCLPLVGISIIMQATIVFDTIHSFTFLAIPLLCIVNQLFLISQKFPGDSDGTPLLVMLHGAAILQLVYCFFGLFAFLVIYGPRTWPIVERKAPRKTRVSETTARSLFAFFNMFFLVLIAVGSLYYGAWNSWEDSS